MLKSKYHGKRDLESSIFPIELSVQSRYFSLKKICVLCVVADRPPRRTRVL